MRGLGIGVFCAVLSVAGCGGGDESDSLPDEVRSYTTTVPPEGRSLADWQAASRAICTESFPHLMAAIDSVNAQTTIEGAFAEVRRALDISADLLEQLRSIPVPTERPRQVERVNDRLARAAQAVAAERRDIDAGRPDAAGSYLGVLTNYGDTDDLYVSLDVPECAPNAK